MAVCELGPSGKVTEDGLIAALERVFQQEKDAEVRSFILLGMAELAKSGKSQARAYAVIRQALRSDSNQTLLPFACLAAGVAQDRASLPLLREIFSTKSNPDVRSTSAIALGLLKDVASTQLLVDAIKGPGEPGTKQYCCVALGMMGLSENKEALPVLRELLTQGTLPELRAAAAMALAFGGDRTAVQTVLKATEEGSAYVRMSAIISTGYFRDLNTLPALMKLFENESNGQVQWMILTAIGYILEDVPYIRDLGMNFNWLLEEKYHQLLEIVFLL
jgi:HEAT repeat protein